MDLFLKNNHVTPTPVFGLHKNKFDLFNKIFQETINCKSVQESVIEIVPSDLKCYHEASILSLFLVAVMRGSGCRG